MCRSGSCPSIPFRLRIHSQNFISIKGAVHLHLSGRERRRGLHCVQAFYHISGNEVEEHKIDKGLVRNVR